MSYLSRIAMRAAVPATAPSVGGAGGHGQAHPSLRSDSPLTLADQRLNMPELASVPDLGFGDVVDGNDPGVAEVADPEAATVRYGGFDAHGAGALPLDVPAAPAPAAPAGPVEVGSSAHFPGLSRGEPAALPRSEHRVEIISQVMPSSPAVAHRTDTLSVRGEPARSFPPVGAPAVPEIGAVSGSAVPAPESVRALASALSRAHAWIEQPVASIEPRHAEPATVRVEVPISGLAPIETNVVEPPAVGLHIGSIHVEVVPPAPAHVGIAKERAAQSARRTAPRERNVSRGEARAFGWRQR